MGRLIDQSAPDIQYFFNRAQRSTVMNPVTQDAFNHSRTIFYHDKVEYDYGNRRHLSRDVVLHTGIDSVKEDYKPNMIHIDEYDNMYLTVNQQTEDTDLKEIIDYIPGFSIDEQGQVTADGTTIRKVFLNGKEISL